MDKKNTTENKRGPYAATAHVRFRIVGVLALMAVFFIPYSAMGQTGTIIGEITEVGTGESLPGATVMIQGTTIGTSSDVDGRYTLRRVPAGEQVVEVRYMGYTTRQTPVTVSGNERVELNVALVSDMIVGDEVFVMASQRGEARALTLQRQSINIRSVMSSEQIDRFGDQTVSSALSRMAGMGHGGTNIRGVGAGMSNVTMDGQRMGTTGDASRTHDLSGISADMIESLEVIKVITPDMDADALSGVININTRRPIGGQRDVNARLGGGWSSRFLGLTGPSHRASFSYGDSPSDAYSYGVNLSYQRGLSTSESVRFDWATRNFLAQEFPTDVLTRFDSVLSFQPSDRYGTSLQFTFQPTDRTTFHVRGLYNYTELERTEYVKNPTFTQNRYFDSHLYTGDPAGQYFGGHGGGANRIYWHNEFREQNTHQFTFQAGARHLFDAYDMEYAFGWGHGRRMSNTYQFQFRTEGKWDFVFHNLDEDRLNLGMTFADWFRTYFPIPREFDYYRDRNIWSGSVDNDLKGSIDIEAPFSLGKFKFGSSALMTFKRGYKEDHQLADFDGRASMADFEMRDLTNEWFVFDRQQDAYRMPYLMDVSKMVNFFETQNPHFSGSLQNWADNSETGDFLADEHVFAAYGMSEFGYGRWTFLGGLRVEQSVTRYSGKDIEIDREGHLAGVIHTEETNAYITFFPNAQTIYALGNMTNLRLAYSRGIARPSFNQLSPTVNRIYSSERISQGNPKLNPMVSDNVDLLFEHYFMDVGQLTVAVFYKNLTDFVYSYTEFIGGDGEMQADFDLGVEDNAEFAGWRFSSYLNGEEAEVYGLEVSWSQKLAFLPGFLSNLGIYSNYSYADSRADIGRRTARGAAESGDIIWTRMANQRPHVINVGLDYSQGGFSGHVSYRFLAAAVSSYRDLRAVPSDRSVPIHERRYFDRYRDAANNLRLSLRYRVTGNIRLWADANNVLNQKSVNYSYKRDLYPRSITLSGRSANVGIRYTF